MATREEIREALTRRIATRMIELAANVHAELTAATPVDTGFAQANWQFAVGDPPTGTVGIGSGSGIGIVDPEAIDPATTLVYLGNNARYIRRLNGGHSKQAPAGFVEASIAKAVAG